MDRGFAPSYLADFAHNASYTQNCSSQTPLPAKLYSKVTSFAVLPQTSLVRDRHWLQLCLTLCTPRFLCSGDFPGKNTGEGCLALLQGVSRPRDGDPRLFASYVDRQVLYLSAIWEALCSVALTPPCVCFKTHIPTKTQQMLSRG